MGNISIWKDTINNKKFKKLNSNEEVDILIIGGGITGISTYYHLRNSNLKVMLVESNKIGYGTTGNSTGKLTYLQNDLLNKIDNKVLYLKSQIEAINMIKKVIEEEKIDCDLENVSSYLYTNNETEIDKIKEIANFLTENGLEVIKENNNLVDSIYTIKVDDTYMFHPIKFLYGLINDNDLIYEDTRIINIRKDNNYYLCETDDYVIKTKYVVIASHYPYFNMPYLFPVKGNLEKSYLSASTYNGDKVSLISYSNPFISIRTYKDYLIYLSNTHSNDKDTDDLKNYQGLAKKVLDLKLVPTYLWSNIDIITNDYLPYIGSIKDNMLIGTGYNTWGLTNGFLAGKILSDIILEKDNPYIELFDPKRINLKQVTGVLSDMVKSINGYISGITNKNEKVIYDKINGKDVMIYKEDDKEYIVYRKCPHMGCNLIFNEIEKTWDCPCHGSRFDLTGKCINSPANQDITFKEE